MGMPTIRFSRGQGRRALDQTRSGYGAALLVALAWMSEPTLAVAQSAPEFVIHLWVDPRFGDDQLAAGSGAMNPDGLNTVQMESLCALAPCPCTNPCTNSGLRPNDVVDGSGRALVHAPYPFRTLSAAVAYINAIPSRSGAALGTPPLPYTGSNGNVWKAAIIHLLPGLYGELLPAAWVAQFGSHHPDNGLVPNGESFPIMLPRHALKIGSVWHVSHVVGSTIGWAGSNPPGWVPGRLMYWACAALDASSAQAANTDERNRVGRDRVVMDRAATISHSRPRRRARSPPRLVRAQASWATALPHCAPCP